MQTNRRLFITGLILISVTTLAALGFWWSVKLEGPVFFEQFRERTSIVGTTPEGFPLYQQVTLQMPFLTDASDKRVIERVVFPEVPWPEDQVRIYYEPGAGLTNFMGTPVGKTTIGRYNFNTLMVSIDLLEAEPFGPVKLTHADLYYANGERETVEIGEIYLSGIELPEGHFEHRSSGGTSDHSYESNFSVEIPMEVLEVKSPLMSELEALFEIKINGESAAELQGAKFSEGDSVHTTAVLKGPWDITQQFTVYDLTPVLTYRTTEGEIYSQRLMSIIEYQAVYRPENFLDLVRYLRARGVL